METSHSFFDFKNYFWRSDMSYSYSSSANLLSIMSFYNPRMIIRRALYPTRIGR